MFHFSLQLSSLTADTEGDVDGDDGATSPERSATVEGDDGKCTEGESVDVKPEIGDVSSLGECTSAQRGGVGDTKGRHKKHVLVGDKRSSNRPSGDVADGPEAVSELSTCPSGRDVKLPNVIKGNVCEIKSLGRLKYRLIHSNYS